MANRAWGWCLVGALAIGMVAGEALLGCGHSGAVAPAGEALRVLENGTFSGVRQDGERVFRTSGEWEGFYAQHRAAPPPRRWTSRGRWSSPSCCRATRAATT